MENVETFKDFLQSRQTGLVQRSPEWLKARQTTIGASEISALTGSSPFENTSSLIRKKTKTTDMFRNVACTWGYLFEPILRRYFEQKHSVKVFGHMMFLDLAKDHPLYGKVTCSPDGYFPCKDGSIALLEIKCPYKRKIAVYKTPRQYVDQIQTGLALSGEGVKKGLFVDACFRMSSFKHLNLGLEHNYLLNGGSVPNTKRKSALACGICLLSSKKRLYKNQSRLLDLGATKSTSMFERVMHRISSNEIFINPLSSYVEFKYHYHCEEFHFLKEVNKNTFTEEWPANHYKPVAFFAWKLLDISEIWEHKIPNFLESFQTQIITFHKKLEVENTRQSNSVETAPNTLKDDSAILKDFLKEQV